MTLQHLRNGLCPITKKKITLSTPLKDNHEGVSYILPDINESCVLKLSLYVLLNDEIMYILRWSAHFLLENLKATKKETFEITPQNYLAQVIQFSHN